LLLLVSSVTLFAGGLEIVRLFVLAIVSAALLVEGGAASAGAPAPLSASAGGWTGTVTVVEDANHTFSRTDSAGDPGTTTVVYHDQATYTLTGETGSDGLEVAQMNGSGTGQATGSYPPACTLTYTRFLQWTYAGPAKVAVSYAGGRFLVQPQGVETTFTNLITGCGRPDSTQTSDAPAPEGVTQIHAQGVSAAANATTISGTETFPLSFVIVNVSEVAGTITMSWSLHRAAGALCRVPKVVGKPLAAAKKAIGRAGCAVGRVTTKRSSVTKGRVIAQAPRAGKSVPLKTKVSLVVSRG
jgi:hypothetical protein